MFDLMMQSGTCNFVISGSWDPVSLEISLLPVDQIALRASYGVLVCYIQGADVR